MILKNAADYAIGRCCNRLLVSRSIQTMGTEILIDGKYKPSNSRRNYSVVQPIYKNVATKMPIFPQIQQYRMICHSYFFCWGETTTTAASTIMMQANNHGQRQKRITDAGNIFTSIITRDFATNRKGKGRGGRNSNANEPLTNDDLVTKVMRLNKGKNAKNIQVRLVIDQGKGEKSEIEVMSLMEAITKSTELRVDLVAINLEQDVPVISAVDFQKLLYLKSKKSSSGGSGGSQSVKKQTKEYKFKAGIEDNDLQRKADNMIGYLNKGHACQVTISSNRRRLMADEDAVVTTLNRVREIVGDNAVESRALQKNERGSFGKLMLQPNTKKK